MRCTAAHWTFTLFALSSAPARAQTAEELFDDRQVHQIELRMHRRTGNVCAPTFGLILTTPCGAGGRRRQPNVFVAPLLFVSAGQINVQTPWGETGSGIVPITAVVGAAVGNTITAEIGPVSPGISRRPHRRRLGVVRGACRRPGNSWWFMPPDWAP
jgi:hypothetical protein